MWPRFGLKIGNSTVCIAVAKDDGNIEVIANKQGDRVSYAILLSECDEIDVGITAKQKMPSKLLATVANSFQLFPNNLTDEEITNNLKYIPCKYNFDTKKFDLIQQGEEKPHRSISPYEVCVEFFKASFELARQCHISEEHPTVVLSIPDYYPSDCWDKLAKAAQDAGFHVGQIISESTAAVLAYELGEKFNIPNNDIINGTVNQELQPKSNNNKTVLFIKSGGICSTFTLFNINMSLYSIIALSGPYYIGGKNITECLVEFIKTEFSKKYHLDATESRRSMAKISTAADNCKNILTTLPSTQIYIDSLMDGIDFNIQMSRAKFENLIQPVLNEFLTILNKALEGINKSNTKIDEIVLAGATLKIPKIQSMISSRFPDANLNIKFSTDEVVAIGCARQSKFLIDPLLQDLESTTNLSLTTSDIYIWQDDILNIDNNKKILLCKEGTITPTQIRFNIEINSENNFRQLTNDVDENDEYLINDIIFNVESSGQIRKIKLENQKEPINGVIRIEADIQIHDSEYPSITLRTV